MGGGRSGGGVERVNSEKAREQLAARKQTIKDSKLSNLPSVGGALSQAMGEFSIAQQEKGLEEGGYAVAVPGTSFAPQGQAYTEAPGMRSSAKLASKGFKVGKTMERSGTKTSVPTRPGMMPMTAFSESQFVNVPSGSIGKISATKPPKGSGEGYVGDVAGVVKEGELFGQKTKTFTGKTGYSPSGEKIDEPKGGGGQEQTLVAQAEAEEAAPESTMAMLPGETPSQYRRRVRRYGGGTIVEGGGVLYK